MYPFIHEQGSSWIEEKLTLSTPVLLLGGEHRVLASRKEEFVSTSKEKHHRDNWVMVLDTKPYDLGLILGITKRKRD